MKTIRQFLKDLGFTPFRVIRAYLFGGKLWGVAKLGCEGFSKLLKKVAPSDLVCYASWTSRFAQCIRYDIDVLATNEDAKSAGTATVDAVETFATHLADGEYTSEELQSDVNNVNACINAWKSAVKG